MSEASSGSGVLWTLFRYEIRMILRDTRMILIALVVPLLLFPVLILVMRAVQDREETRLEEATYEYALVGDEVDWGRPILEEAIRREAEADDSTRAPVRFQAVAAQDADALLEAEEVHLVVEALSFGRYREAVEAERDVPDDSVALEDEEAVGPATPVFRLKYRAGSDFSRNAMTSLQGRLAEIRTEMRDSAYRASGFPIEPDGVASVTATNIASAEREGGAALGLLLTPFLLLLMLSGGSIVAVDAISGEKERGTLETLLTTAATRREIVTAKQLAIIVVGLTVAVVNVVNLLVYLVLGVLEPPENLAVALSALDLLILLVLFVPLTVLVSSALLLLSGYAKSYKEYQIYFFPVFVAFLAPALAGMLPGMDLRSAIALVPIAGIGVAVREVMVGERDWLFLAVALLSSGGLAWWLTRLTERALSTERLISGADLDEADLFGGPALFPKRVLRWFTVLWVVFFLTSLWFGEALGLRGQILVNLVGIFLGGSILMVRRYGLPVREAFALRPVRGATWLAVLIGAPSGYVVGIGLATLVNLYLFPVPQDVIEAFGEVMLGDEMPLWQLLFFLTVLPGVLEELAFRGVLLHGLRKRLRPIGVCLAVGAIFGLFHVSLFRLVPTGYLGAVLAGVVLLTGSIFPAMLWHGLNNAIALVPAYYGWVGADSELPLWAYPLAVIGLLACFAILWTVRSPYPDLRTDRRSGGNRRSALRPSRSSGSSSASL